MPLLARAFLPFNWPQPPDQAVVRAQKIERVDKEVPLHKILRKIMGPPLMPNLKECPKCGILFDKAKKLHTLSAGMPPAGRELLEAWDAVKANYQDPKRHEGLFSSVLIGGT